MMQIMIQATAMQIKCFSETTGIAFTLLLKPEMLGRIAQLEE